MAFLVLVPTLYLPFSICVVAMVAFNFHLRSSVLSENVLVVCESVIDVEITLNGVSLDLVPLSGNEDFQVSAKVNSI